MMGQRILKLSTMLLLVLGLTGLKAQDAIPASGGNASGSGGSTSYSIGQVVYTTHTGTSGIVAEGVQQPYEISVVTGIDKAKGISLSVSAYPNPTTSYLILKVDNFEQSNLSYQLHDINGKLLQNGKITSSETNIVMGKYASATYLVKVQDQSKKEIKIFKIVKK